LSGDFNSLPDSGVYEYLATGILPPQHPDFQGFKYEPFTNQGCHHSLCFKDVYESKEPITLHDSSSLSSSVPLVSRSSSYSASTSYTNYSPDFKGVLDYIWYSSVDPGSGSGSSTTSSVNNTASSCQLVLSGVLDLYPKQYFEKIVGLPNPHLPSDHVSLMAEFKLVSIASTRKQTSLPMEYAGTGSHQRSPSPLSGSTSPANSNPNPNSGRRSNQLLYTSTNPNPSTTIPSSYYDKN
jgi:CCR4-NOT transcription complex subunit 6